MAFSYKRHEFNTYLLGGRRGCDRIVVAFLTTYASNAYHQYRWKFESRSSNVYSMQRYVIQLSVTRDRSVVFSRYSVSSNNKTNIRDITELLLKVALKTTTLILYYLNIYKDIF